MISDCSEQQQRIPRSFMGDLSAAEQQALESHMSVCPPCRHEHERYAETLNLLHSTGDEPVPRHFFVYPGEQTAKPWQLFRQMTLRWQAACVAFALLILTINIAAFTGFRVQSGQGAWTLSLGLGGSSAGGIDATALKSDLLKIMEERDRESATEWIRYLRSEIVNSRTELTSLQQAELMNALTGLESRLNGRLAETAEGIRSGTQNAAVDLYQTVSLERQQELNRMNARLDMIVENHEAKTRETDSILETLIQVANINLRQAGEQK